jgi:drug/metabolite transporter (DMT)-like permease
MFYYLSILLVVASTVVYHLTQKATPADAHPLLALAVTYIAATGLCLALLPFFPLRASLGESLWRLNWASIALAAAVTGIEVGFLLAYRAGWNIGLAALIANTAVAAILAPVGLLLFAERLTLIQVVGIAVCMLGLALINYR